MAGYRGVSDLDDGGKALVIIVSFAFPILGIAWWYYKRRQVYIFLIFWEFIGNKLYRATLGREEKTTRRSQEASPRVDKVKRKEKTWKGSNKKYFVMLLFICCFTCFLYVSVCFPYVFICFICFCICFLYVFVLYVFLYVLFKYVFICFVDVCFLYVCLYVVLNMLLFVPICFCLCCVVSVCF